jgi:hypothetical protein
MTGEGGSVIDDVIDSVKPGSPIVRRLWLLVLTFVVAVLVVPVVSSSGV